MFRPIDYVLEITIERAENAFTANCVFFFCVFPRKNYNLIKILEKIFFSDGTFDSPNGKRKKNNLANRLRRTHMYFARNKITVSPHSRAETVIPHCCLLLQARDRCCARH